MTAPGSAATRSGPSRAASSRTPSSAPSGPSRSGRAPSAAASPASDDRLVTTTRHPALPGSSGRTCAASRALSSTISTRRPASTLRYNPHRACASAGICPAGTPSATRNHPVTSSAVTAAPSAS